MKHNQFIWSKALGNWRPSLATLWALAALTIAAPALSACSDDDDDDSPAQVDPTITIDADLLNKNVKASAASVIIPFTANAKWQASVSADAQDWISLGRTSGGSGAIELTVSFAANESQQRTGTITITCNGYSVNITINQAAYVAPDPTAVAGRADVMLQGFYWDSQKETGWTQLMDHVDEIAKSFTCVWFPPSAQGEGGSEVGGNNVGYHPRQWDDQNSCWGTAADLKAIIAALHQKDVKVIADIVVNHRAGATGWGDFTPDDFGSYGSFQLTWDHICSNDEMNDASQCTDANWYGKAKGAADTGENWGAARDLDHTSTYVQQDCKAYLNWLKGEFGYDGWRYDFVKGFNGKYVMMYNEATDPYLSVGEYWDGNYDAVSSWINTTGYNSMAFDFPQKYAALNNGLAAGNFSNMTWKEDGTTARPAGLAHHATMRAYSVTFVDNHDTYRDDSKFTGNVQQAYAFILTSPGVPCVFWPHWQDEANHDAIDQMIASRHAVGLGSESDVVVTQSSSYYEAQATGSKGTLICRIGAKAPTTAPDGYTLACSGNGWAYYTKMK